MLNLRVAVLDEVVQLVAEDARLLTQAPAGRSRPETEL
jgi:hypothetical protein